ncbi:ankyrin repeat domain protein [Nitzschia inconspicua]|uniref:Ankyrin repeat domain protein n=1 Tax=Nitzschia inconspicua TaxID=303405 RepID=A0A9K3PXD7_9STRA|nr:ankyrin repeat domain protein [Nitzschia inconspicua]
MSNSERNKTQHEYFSQQLSSILSTEQHVPSSCRTLSASDANACRTILQEYPQLLRQPLDFGHRIGYGVHSHQPVYPILQLCYRQAPIDLIRLALNFNRDDHHGEEEEVVVEEKEKEDHAIPSYSILSLSDRDAGGYTALHWACCGTLTQSCVIKLLLDHYPTAAYQMSFGNRTCLHHACENGLAVEAVDELLQKCPHHALERDHCQNIPLHLACASGPLSQLSVIQRLVSLEPSSAQATSQLGWRGEESRTGIVYRSIPPYDTRGMGYTPLHYACGEGAPLDVVRYLVRQFPGALGLPASSQALPLHWACSKRFPTLDVISFLVAQYPRALHLSTTNGCSVASGGGGTPLQLAAKSRPSLPVIRFLYQQCPTALEGPSNKKDTGFLALQYACCNGASSEVIEFLMEKSNISQSVATLSVRTGETLLHMVCRNNVSHSLIPAMLTRFPDDVAVMSTNTGDSPLHAACEAGASIQNIQPLVLSKNADGTIQMPNKDGNLPLHLLVQRKQSPVDVVDLRVCRYLVDQFPGSLITENLNHETPFDVAISIPFRSEGSAVQCTCSLPKKRKVDPVDYMQLLEVLTPPLPAFQNSRSGLPLPFHYLVTRSNKLAQVEMMMEFLLDHFPKVCHERNLSGELLLHVASRIPRTSLAIIECLFQQNPDAIQIPNQEGLVPFQVAAVANTSQSDSAGELSVVYFLVHQSLFAFENLASLRDRLLCTKVCGSDDVLPSTSCDGQIRMASNAASSSSLSRTLKEVLDEHHRAMDLRIDELQRELQEVQLELERRDHSESCASCCRIS